MTGVYFLATTEGDRENINGFKMAIAKFPGEDSILKTNFDDWQSLFSALEGNSSFQTKAKGSKVIIAIDEFPQLIEANRVIPSVFLKLYDTLPSNIRKVVEISSSI